MEKEELALQACIPRHNTIVSVKSYIFISNQTVMTRYPKPMRDIIYEIVSGKNDVCTIQEMYEKIKRKYPKTEINKNTVATQMSDLATNGPDSSTYSMQKRFLKRIGRGTYKLIR